MQTRGEQFMRFFSKAALPAAVLALLSISSSSRAQSCGTISNTSIQEFPAGTRIIHALQKEAGTGNALTIPATVGVCRANVDGNPGSPSLQFYQIGSLGGGPIQISGDTWQGISTGGGYFDSSGGRVAVAWNVNGALAHGGVALFRSGPTAAACPSVRSSTRSAETRPSAMRSSF